MRIDANEVVRLVRASTAGQVRDLEAEVWSCCVVLRGQADSYYVKQLAQHELRQRLPADFALENLIAVGQVAPATINYFDPQPAARRSHQGRPLIVIEPAKPTHLAPRLVPSTVAVA